MKPILLSIIFSVLFTSCYQYKEVKVTSIENFNLKKIDKKEMITEITVKIKNPNNFSFNIYSGKAAIFWGNIPLGKAHLQKKVPIPASSNGTYTLTLKTSFEKINLQDIIQNFNFSNVSKMKINGHIKAGRFLLRKKIKTDYEGNPLNNLHFNFNSN